MNSENNEIKAAEESRETVPQEEKKQINALYGIQCVEYWGDLYIILREVGIYIRHISIDASAPIVMKLTPLEEDGSIMSIKKEDFNGEDSIGAKKIIKWSETLFRLTSIGALYLVPLKLDQKNIFDGMIDWPCVVIKKPTNTK